MKSWDALVEIWILIDSIVRRGNWNGMIAIVEARHMFTISDIE